MPQWSKETRHGGRRIRAGRQIAGWTPPQYRPRILPAGARASRPIDRWRLPQELRLRGPAPRAYCNPRHTRRWPDIEAEYRPDEDWKSRWPASVLRAASCRVVQLASASPQWSGGDSLARRRTLFVRGRTNEKRRDTWPSPPLPPWPHLGVKH